MNISPRAEIVVAIVIIALVTLGMVFLLIVPQFAALAEQIVGHSGDSSGPGKDAPCNRVNQRVLAQQPHEPFENPIVTCQISADPGHQPAKEVVVQGTQELGD